MSQIASAAVTKPVSRIWTLLQIAFWLIGVTLFALLLWMPDLGLLLFWNLLIPVAPALLVIATGLWRNVCPMATTVLIPRKLGWSAERKLSATASGWLSLTAVLLLFIIIPLRHAVFNTNALATALLLAGACTVGFLLGFRYEWKSIWCSGLCPVHPVEKLYGSRTVFSFPNAHCQSCHNCVVPCPDSTPGNYPLTTTSTTGHQLAALLITGALPGYIWGWFQVPDQVPSEAGTMIASTYQWPLTGGLMTLTVFLLLYYGQKSIRRELLSLIFAASAVSCYYWFRLPSLIGMGKIGKDGLLIDLSASLPAWIPYLLSFAITGFFVYWMLLRQPPKRSWSRRPAFDPSVVKAAPLSERAVQ